MSKFNDFLNAFSKWSPIKFEVAVKPNKLIIANHHYELNNNKIIFGDTNNDVFISKDKEGNLLISVNDIDLSKFFMNKSENIKLLESKGKVFTRVDISEAQIEELSIEKKHEDIIRKLKPYLLNYRQNKDLSALLVASSIIKLEDNRERENLVIQKLRNLNMAYPSVGNMIYNLFRSEILEKEIFLYLENLEKAYKDIEKIKRNFLIYWFSIIKDGYPTAYFVQFYDSENEIFKEIDWRLNRGERYVDVFSRTNDRNKKVESWCRNYCRKGKFTIKVSKTYNLGFTPAKKFRISIKRNK